MLDFVRELSTFQLILIGVGLLILFPTIKDLFLSLFTVKQSVTKAAEDVVYDTDLTAIVKKWESLADHCKEARLVEAYNKLEDLFPLLLKAKVPPTVGEGEDDKQPPPF